MTMTQTRTMDLQHIANGWLVLRGTLDRAYYFATKEEAEQYLKRLTVAELNCAYVKQYGGGL